MGKVGRPIKRTTEAVVKDIRRQPEESLVLKKISIVLRGLKGEESTSEICRKEGIALIEPRRYVLYLVKRHLTPKSR